MKNNKKLKKVRKGKIKSVSSKLQKVLNCKYGIKTIENGYIKIKHIESARKIIKKNINKNDKVIIKIKPNKSTTKKPIEVRMGGGKGELSENVYNLKKGNIIYEINCDKIKLAKKILKLVSHKLPLKVILDYKSLYSKIIK